MWAVCPVFTELYDFDFEITKGLHCAAFRPEYRVLGTLRERFPEASLHGFTATATERVRRDIVTQLGLREPQVLVGSFDYRMSRKWLALRTNS